LDLERFDGDTLGSPQWNDRVEEILIDAMQRAKERGMLSGPRFTSEMLLGIQETDSLDDVIVRSSARLSSPSWHSRLVSYWRRSHEYEERCRAFGHERGEYERALETTPCSILDPSRLYPRRYQKKGNDLSAQDRRHIVESPGFRSYLVTFLVQGWEENLKLLEEAFVYHPGIFARFVACAQRWLELYQRLTALRGFPAHLHTAWFFSFAFRLRLAWTHEVTLEEGKRFILANTFVEGRRTYFMIEPRFSGLIVELGGITRELSLEECEGLLMASGEMFEELDVLHKRVGQAP
ncbi:MAG: hypothetical protein AAGI01_17540, partial [Myxococcota bacterium]